jgi:hypothetical protein
MTSIPDLEQRLAQVQAAFDAAPAEGPSQFDPPPDGDYQTLLHEYDFFEGGDPKQAFMKIRFQIQHHPEHAGHFIEKVYTIETEDGVGYLKSDLHRMGVNVEGFQLSRIATGELQSETLDLPLLIRVKRPGKLNRKGKEIVNVWIQQRLGDPVRAQSVGEARGWNPSDVPGAQGDEFVHPDQGKLDDVPFTGDEETPEGQGNQEAHLRELGCICDDPVKTEADGKGFGNIECPVPGHAPF